MVFILLVTLLTLTSNLGQAEDKIIKVGLMNNTKKLKIIAEDGLELKTSNGYNLALNDAKKFIFIKTGEFIRINNYFFASNNILVSPLGKELVKIEKRGYKGTIKLINNKRGITVVNKVGMKDYLASVIGSEIDPKWPLAALKAQAVVARTYALRNLNAYASKGYHLSNTTYSQAYKGDHVTTEKIYKAVNETKREVLTYDGNLISAVYHSNAGGKTAQGEVIWGGQTPYLQSVSSKDEYAPNYKWQKKYSTVELEKILAQQDIKISTIDKIYLAGVGPSGRAKEVILSNKRKNIVIDSSEFRFWLDLRSTKFSIEKLSEGYLFKGKGWGHGVGMSQWGAYQMAKTGSTYQGILAHYYQNTKLVKKDVGGIDDEG